MSGYENLLKHINLILLKRKSTIFHKQANLFTTNIDIFLEKSMENIGLDYNSGFSGNLNPKFSTGNFKKIYSQQSFHDEKLSEIPLFNLLKIHGSLTWKKQNESIILDKELKYIGKIKDKLDEIKEKDLLKIEDKDEIKDIIRKAPNVKCVRSSNGFIKEFERLSIVLPTKKKLNETLINSTHYDLLRIYSNDLEKENSVLFIMGFSLSDEHIKLMTKRAIASNPTLIVYIFAHKEETEKDLKGKIGESRLNNIKYVPRKGNKDYNLKNIANFFKEILNKVRGRNRGRINE